MMSPVGSTLSSGTRSSGLPAVGVMLMNDGEKTFRWETRWSLKTE